MLSTVSFGSCGFQFLMMENITIYIDVKSMPEVCGVQVNFDVVS